MRIALVQMRSGVSVAENITALQRFVREAVNAGAEYVQTPEMTGILQKNSKRLFAAIGSGENDPLVAAASALAREFGIWLHIGSHAMRFSDVQAANRSFIFAPDGKIVATYDKIHMFDVDLDNGESWRESKVYKPGSDAVLAKVANMTVGMSICYDVRFPVLYRELAEAGAQILTAPAAFTRQTGHAHWHVLLRARAIENGAFMLAAAQGGNHEDGRETYGHSLVVNPWGEIIAELSGDEPGVLIAELDLLQVADARKKVPNLADARTFRISGVENTEARS